MIERTEKMERADRQQVRRGNLQNHVAVTSKPYTGYAEVNLFKARMKRAQRGIEDRSPMLVIVGPSMFGRSAFARSIYNSPHAVSCQGVAEPNLSGLDSEESNCVIMEEIDVDVVTNNKELFQRNSNGVRRRQCKMGVFREWYYLHGIPFVGVTNKWPESRADTPQHWGWFQAIIIVLRLTV